jgi:cytochrome c biogenesis protein CcdA
VLALIALVAAVAAIDSANPTTVGPALYLATTKSARSSVAQFTLGVFAVSLAGGVILTFGPGKLLVDALPRPGHDVEHWIEIGLGVAALIAAAVLWQLRARLSGRAHHKEHQVGRSSLLLGAGIMLVEFPTALPYFAVIAALVESEASSLAQLLLLVLFNVIFVAPLVVILGVRLLASDKAVERLERLRAAIHRRMGVLIPAAVALVGVVLILVGGVGLAQD